ncbi:MAG: alpha/beta hydrolase family protein [Desulfomonilaceae bacterium]
MEFTLVRTLFNKLLEALRIDKPPKNFSHVDHAGLRSIESFSVLSDSITLRGKIFFPVQKPDMLYPTVVICHGIPGSGAPRPSDDPGYEGMAQDFTSLGFASVIFNFRGCGDSGGDFDIMGWTRDLRAILDKISNTPFIDPTRIFLVGFSGGGAAAIYVSADNPNIYGLAVVGTPSNFEIFRKDVSSIIRDFRQSGIIRSPAFPADTQKWMDGFSEIQPSKWISYFKGKTILIIHGASDELIPVEQAHELYSHAPSGITRLEIIPDGVHRLRLDQRCINFLKTWAMKSLGWKR